MIIDATIIAQPFAGEYKEKIYDIESEWKTQNWTFIKFINDDYSEWCGQFRGFPKNVAISEKFNTVLILTANFLFEINRNTNEIINFEEQPQYQNVISSPNGNYILIDYYNIFKVNKSISNIEIVKSKIQMDMIEFKYWENQKMIFTCDEFLNNNNQNLKMELDSESWEIRNAI